MTERTTDAPNLHSLLALAGLFLSSTLYAALLNTQIGKRWAKKQTWTTVVVGVALTLLWMATEDHKMARRTLLYFAVSGVPMIARSLALDFIQFEEMLEALT